MRASLSLSLCPCSCCYKSLTKQFFSVRNRKTFVSSVHNRQMSGNSSNFPRTYDWHSFKNMISLRQAFLCTTRTNTKLYWILTLDDNNNNNLKFTHQHYEHHKASQHLSLNLCSRKKEFATDFLSSDFFFIIKFDQVDYSKV